MKIKHLRSYFLSSAPQDVDAAGALWSPAGMANILGGRQAAADSRVQIRLRNLAQKIKAAIDDLCGGLESMAITIPPAWYFVEVGNGGIVLASPEARIDLEDFKNPGSVVRLHQECKTDGPQSDTYADVPSVDT